MAAAAWRSATSCLFFSTISANMPVVVRTAIVGRFWIFHRNKVTGWAGWSNPVSVGCGRSRMLLAEEGQSGLRDLLLRLESSLPHVQTTDAYRLEELRNQG